MTSPGLFFAGAWDLSRPVSLVVAGPVADPDTDPYIIKLVSWIEKQC